MKIIDVQQGTPEWVAARCGLPTASCFDKIVDTSGKPSKQRKKYLFQLAGERVVGSKDAEQFKSGAMQRGTELEPEARSLYELITGAKVRQVGFCITEGDAVYGASPDGLVDDDGSVQIKCPLIPAHVSYLLDGGLPSEYFQQVQGELLVTGLKWCDFFSYYPGLKPLLFPL